MGRNSTLSKRTQRFAEENLANARKTAKSAHKAAQSGWHDISGTFDNAVDRSQHLAGDAKSRFGGAYSKLHDVQDEGLRRTKAAKDALAGKRPARRRPWVAGAALLGVAFGAVGAIYARRVARARELAQAEDAAAAVAADLAEHDPALNGRVNGSGPSAAYLTDVNTNANTDTEANAKTETETATSLRSATTAKVAAPPARSNPAATPKSTDLP